MMPEQQSLVLYIFFGLLPGRHVASLWKTATGAVFGSLDLFSELLPTTI